MSAWTAEPDHGGYGGDVGGDAQVTESFLRRYRRPGVGAVVDVYFYGADWRIIRPGGTNPPADDDPEEYVVAAQYEFTMCTDPDHPGDTETYFDAIYLTNTSRTYTDLGEVEKAARTARDAHTGDTIDWSGTSRNPGIHQARTPGWLNPTELYRQARRG